MGTITVNRAELGKALDFASLGLSRRPVVPIMGGMRVVIDGGTLELAAFDYETAASARTSGDADGPGRVLVDGREFAAVVKSLPKGAKVTAEIGVEDDGLIVLCDGIEITLSALPLNEYPKLPDLPGQSGLVDAETFTRTIGRLVLAAGRDDTLPVLTGVKFTSQGGTLEGAATDRCRLTIAPLPWTGPDGAEALIPAVALAAFAAKADKTGKVSLHFDGERAGMSDGTRTLITRTIQGEYVKYRDRLPSGDEAATTVLVDAGKLAAAVKRAAMYLERGMPVTLDITDAGVTVRTDGGIKSSQAVTAAVEGEPMLIGFNPQYFYDALAGIDGEAYIALRSASKPALITSADEADQCTGVCMPLRPQS